VAVSEKDKKEQMNKLKVPVIIYHLLRLKLENGGIYQMVCYLSNPSPPSNQAARFRFELRRWILGTYQAPDSSGAPSPPTYQAIVYTEFTGYDYPHAGLPLSNDASK
jgi:hypothetical protein